MYEVRTCRWDYSLKGLDGNPGQLDLILVDVADRRMQDHTDLIQRQCLVDIFYELAKEAEALNCGKPELKVFSHCILAHYLQELFPVAVRYFNGGNHAQTNACALERISIIASQHRQESILDQATHFFCLHVPYALTSIILYASK